jgi:hypothetical protein
MANDSVNIKKDIETYLLNTCVITQNAKLRKIKHHKHLRQLTQHQRIYSYNHSNEYFQKNFIGNPFVYACDICDRL